MQLSVIIPAFNAQAFVERNIHLLDEFLVARLQSYEIIVVDDGSSDGTSAAVAEIASSHVRLLRLPENLGKFGAIKAGMRESSGNCCIFTDADLPYELEAIPYMEKLVNNRGFHVVIGDRSLGSSEYEQGVTWFRRIFNQLSRNFIRIFIIAGIFDSQCGIKAFRGDVARELFALLQENRFAADVELLYIALKYNLEIKRIPVRIQRVSPSSVKLGRDTFKMLQRLAVLRSSWQNGLYSSNTLSRIAEQAYWS